MEDDGRWNRDGEWDNLWTYDEEEWVPPEVDQVDDRDIDYVWNRLQTDIPFFADFMFDIDLGLRQRQFAWSAIHNRHTLFLSTRQGGKSTMLAVLNAHQMTFAPNTFIEAYAPSFDQARGVIYERTKALFESQEWLYEQIGKIKETGEIRMARRYDWRQTHPNYLQIHTANKASKSLRGFSPSIIEADESGDIPDSKWDKDIGGAGAALKGLTASLKRKLARMPANQRLAYRDKHIQKTKIWVSAVIRRGT